MAHYRAMYTKIMYILTVLLLMFLLPLVSVLLGLSADHAAVVDIIAKWFVFWAVGIRLFTAGLRQIIKPGLTSEGILGIKGTAAYQLVRELGFANFAIGLAAIMSLWHPDWRLGSALAGGTFLFLAGLEHIRKKQRNFEENLAMYSDLAIGLLMVYVLLASL